VVVTEGFTLPEKDVTQVTTNVMVPDGATVIIGGLMKEQLTSTSSQVPYLGSLPYLGFLFRTKKETTERREILVLLTPRIVCDGPAIAEGEQGAAEFHRRHAVYADHMSPLGNRFMGRKYFRMAQEAWARGDRPTALHYVQRSINIDPSNRAAIDLRADIWADSHDGDHSLPPPPFGPPPRDLLDGEELPPWIIEEFIQSGEALESVGPVVAQPTGENPPSLLEPHPAKAMPAAEEE
jgi:hypothetical protein